MQQIRTVVFTFILACSLLAIGACDSAGPGDEEDPAPASFTMSVSGDTEATVEGSAVFGEAEDPETGDEVFAIYLSESDDASDNSETYFFIGRNSSQPSEGTYAFADSEQDGEVPENQFVLISQLGAGAATFVSSGGEIRIDESSGSRLEGAIDVQATGYRFTDTGAEELEVSVEGSFEAVRHDNVLVPFAQ